MNNKNLVNKPKRSQGGKNLLILGAGACLVALLTTSVSLFLYHNSGDIYLDRSRPGFLPDEEESKKDKDENAEYIFSDSGNITKKALDEYLENLKKELDRLENFSDDPFALDSLSNEALGIPNE